MSTSPVKEPVLSEMAFTTPGDCPITGAVGMAIKAAEPSGETTKLSVKPGKVWCPMAVSVALLMTVNWLSENCVPFPLKTRVRDRLGVSTIIPGVLPAEMGATGARTSFAASTIYTPANPVPALTQLVKKALYLRQLHTPLLEGSE